MALRVSHSVAWLLELLKGLGICALGTVVMAWLCGHSRSFVAFSVAAELAAVLYYIVVIWNPSVIELQYGRAGPSPAYQTCCCDPDPRNPPDWKRLTQSTRTWSDAAWSMMGGTAESSLIPSGDYYKEYHGHQIGYIGRVHEALKNAGCTSFIYLIGDSSLDNKHWLFRQSRPKERQMHDQSFTDSAVNGYDRILDGRMVKDVCFHLNDLAERAFGARKVCTIMTAVEASTVDDREPDGLLIQDAFVRDHVTENDYVIVSIGGNDIALRPTLRTAVNMVMLTLCPDFLIQAGLAPGLGYFVNFFQGRIQAILRRLVAKGKPKKILVCMIYYPDVVAGGSWADATLGLLGYNRNPGKLQLIIRKIFDRISSRGFHVDGVEVEPFPLFQVLEEHSDYEQRVEPSMTGGRKMANAFLARLFPPIRR